jgi:hypothetical protein
VSTFDRVLSWTGIALVVLLIYFGNCDFRPWANCLRCKGKGKFKSKSGKTWRRCRRCRGSGERLRVGRRVINYYRQTGRDAS